MGKHVAPLGHICCSFFLLFVVFGDGCDLGCDSVHQPAAIDKKLNTDDTEDTDLAFLLIFFSWQMGLGFIFGFLGFASAGALPLSLDPS